MNIREISDVFKDTAADITAIKSYNFGWASDRVRQGNTEDYQELNEFPRVFFSVPTITASDQTRKQDTYQVTLFFDDLLGYDNEGDADLTLQIDKWALLQNYATAFIQRLNLIKQSILPNYLFIPEAPSFTFDSFVGIQRLVTVQVNFNLVVPTNCEVTVQRIITVVGNALASGVASGNLFRSTSVTGTATATASVFADLTVGGKNIIELFAEVFANGNVTANITRVLNLNANVVTDSTVNASPIIALNLTGNSTATGDVAALPTIIKNLTATATAQASVNAELTVTTQGVVLLEASVTATGTATGEIFRSVTLQSSSNTTAETTATATLTKVLEATATATANTEASAQLTIPVNASATATANTTADAQLSYTVNASATATAETSAEAQIVRIISASATATAESSAEASFGVTFAANVTGTANVDNATIERAATMVASVTAQANVTGATVTTVDNVAASVSAAATVTNANLQLFDANFANVSLLLHGNGTNGSTTFTDSSSNALTVTGVGDAKINTTTFKFPTGSIALDGTGDFLIVTGGTGFEYGTGNFTIECFVYFNSVTGAKIIYDQRISGTETQRPTIYHNGTVLTYYVAGDRITGGTLTTGVWHHIAVSRSGTSTRMYLNGTQVGSTYTDNTNYLNGVGRPLIGSDGFAGANFLNGFVDELRVTKGVARYTGVTITVPTSQFPDQ